MRTICIAFGMLAAVSAIGTPAYAQNYPWCAHYSGSGGAQNCGFSNFAQCQAEVRGIGGFCQRNTQYDPRKRGDNQYQ
jgi:hypothetical protein